jgi:predicted Zn-dependent protease with MMP-like domain
MSRDSDEALPSLDTLEALAREAFATLPREFRELTGNIVFRVADFPDSDTIASLQLRSGYELLGLFHGAPLAWHIANEAGPEPTQIFLYRKPILNFWRTSDGVSLSAIVRNVLIHEIGHHFGFSDEDMDRIEAAAD